MNNRSGFSPAMELYKQAYLSTKSERTQREYVTDLRQLGEYLASVGVLTVQAVQRKHLEGFLAHLDVLALANTTRRRKLAVIRSFFLFLEQAGYRQGTAGCWPATRSAPGPWPG